MKTKSLRTNGEAAPSDDQLRSLIAEAAYYRAEKRGFVPGLEAEDWAAAEQEVLSRKGNGQKAGSPRL